MLDHDPVLSKLPDTEGPLTDEEFVRRLAILCHFGHVPDRPERRRLLTMVGAESTYVEDVLQGDDMFEPMSSPPRKPEKPKEPCEHVSKLRCYGCQAHVCELCSRLCRRRVAVYRVNGGHMSRRTVRLCQDCQKKDR